MSRNFIACHLEVTLDYFFACQIIRKFLNRYFALEELNMKRVTVCKEVRTRHLSFITS
jgi:hypothetical protein